MDEDDINKNKPDGTNADIELESDQQQRIDPFANRKIPRDEDGIRQLRLSDVRDKYSPGSSLMQIITDVVEDAHPELIDRFYPRRYTNVAQYHSPRQSALWLALTLLETYRYGIDRTPTAYRLIVPSLPYLVEHKMPTFFIAPDLLRAVQLSTFAADIPWTDMKLPYESGIFILPRGAYRHAKDGDISMIMWSRLQKDTSTPAWPEYRIPSFKLGHTAMVLLGLCPETGAAYDSLLSDKRPYLRLGNLFYRGPDEAAPNIIKSIPGLDEDLTETDSAFLEGLGVIAFGTLLAMNARPELLRSARLDHIIPAKKDKPRREYWLPNIIGEKYKLRREVPSITKDGSFDFRSSHLEKGGTHASPRMHWRRGHFAAQPYGKERRLRKIIWREPVLVAAISPESITVVDGEVPPPGGAVA